MAIPGVLQRMWESDDEEVRCRIESVVARAQALGIEGEALAFFFETVAQYEALLAVQRTGREAAEAFGHYQQWLIRAYQLQAQAFESRQGRNERVRAA